MVGCSLVRGKAACPADAPIAFDPTLNYYIRMGEARQKSRAKKAVLAGEPRCIYCPNPATTLEHMPPTAMFKDRLRLSGMEFASCEPCNVGTRAADAVASMLAHITPYSDPKDWRVHVLPKFISTLRTVAPDFLKELQDQNNTRKTWRRAPTGLFYQAVEIEMDGPSYKRHLAVFTAKMGMALYREHVGIALPLTGAVFSTWYTNAGLLNDEAEAMLKILPIRGELRQGRKVSTEQFAYRYNCDNKSIFAALVGFHSNLHILVIATSDPETYAKAATSPRTVVLRPGMLSAHLAGSVSAPDLG